ncbi:hypothetical protein EYR27_10360 [Xanthomonas oryzae]|nr:hypothetical protein EYR27_10360 [Xanthomonas oryzae]
MICSSEKRFFTSNLLGIGNWTPNQGATQTRGDVGTSMTGKMLSRVRFLQRSGGFGCRQAALSPGRQQVPAHHPQIRQRK